MDNESFFKMPKVLFTDEYKDLSAEAKLLYILERKTNKDFYDEKKHL